MSEITIKDILNQSRETLAANGDPNPKLSVAWIIADAIGLTYPELHLNLDRELNDSELATIRTNVRLRAEGHPLQYITGKAPFRHIEVAVEPGVLIPRPETEVLVGEVLSIVESLQLEDRTVRIAEIGVGSGCVACSLAYENSHVEVFATDISEDAIRIAAKNVNALSLDSRVHLFLGDLGEHLVGTFDIIVSNPPYIPTAVISSMPSEVTHHEPMLALDGGADGLDFFRRLVEWSKSALNLGGYLVCELHETCLDAAASIASDAGYSDTRVINDLAGKPRVLVVVK